jgi:hypothetical protein
MTSISIQSNRGQASSKLTSPPRQLETVRGLKPIVQQANLQGTGPIGQEPKLLGRQEIQTEGTKGVSPVQKKEESAAVARTENVQGVNGAQMDGADGTDTAKENERTKMSFLLN